jgi:hypothetical protein
MKVAEVLVLLSLVFAWPMCRAQECASLVPEPGRNLVIGSGEWKILGTKDLPEDDAALWASAHSGKCPGVAVGDFTGSQTPAYAIALIRQEPSGKYVEQLALLIMKGRTFSRVEVVSPKGVVGPFVVWTVPPGKYKGVDRQGVVSVRYDSFVYEKMEASATQYYYIDGHLRSLVTAD